MQVSESIRTPSSCPCAGESGFGYSYRGRDRTGPLVPERSRYYGYRWSDPVTGRWVSRDLIEERRCSNLYAFLGNAVIFRWDYLGLDWICSGQCRFFDKGQRKEQPTVKIQISSQVGRGVGHTRLRAEVAAMRDLLEKCRAEQNQLQQRFPYKDASGADHSLDVDFDDPYVSCDECVEERDPPA